MGFESAEKSERIGDVFLTKSVIWKETAIYLNGHEEQVILYKVEASQSRQAS